MKSKLDIKRFLDDSGKITQLSSKNNFRFATLSYLANKFEVDRDYTEKEVNTICDEWHTFGDYFIIRRELIDSGLLCREVNGSRYWKPKKDQAYMAYEVHNKAINSLKKDSDQQMSVQSKKELKEQYKNREIIGGVYRVVCRENGKYWLRATKDIKGSKNRFLFSVATNTCPEACMVKEWKQFGAIGFSFEILEEIVKKETQTDREFIDDTNVLLEIWKDKLKGQQQQV